MAYTKAEYGGGVELFRERKGYWVAYGPVVTRDMRNPLYMEELVGALEKQRTELLKAARKGAVLISLCISPGDKQIARVACH